MCVRTDYSAQPAAQVAVVQAQCELSNDKKLAAKRISELSSELFFSIFVRVSWVTVTCFLHHRLWLSAIVWELLLLSEIIRI